MQNRAIHLGILFMALPMLLGSGIRGDLPEDLHYPDRRMLIRTVLEGLELWSPDVEVLVLRTGAVESLYLFRAGLNDAPERGFWQIHPQTAADVLFRYLDLPSKAGRKARLERMLGYSLDTLDEDRLLLEHELRTNDILGVSICRLWYLLSPYRIPKAEHVRSQGWLWKRWFNTSRGAGTINYFIETVNRLDI